MVWHMLRHPLPFSFLRLLLPIITCLLLDIILALDVSSVLLVLMMTNSIVIIVIAQALAVSRII